MHLDIVTPEGKVFEGEATGVQMPGSMGSFEVLENHAPIISSLEKGKVRVTSGGSEQFFQISGGFVEVLDNKVILLAESVEA